MISGTVLTVYLCIVGLFVGSFLNVLADRLPNGEQVVLGRSHCDRCRKPLRWWELIPVLSFLFLGGRCRRCHTRLSWRYPLSELVTGSAFAALALRFTSEPLLLVLGLVIASALIVIFFADLAYQIIPDSMTLIALATVIVYVAAADPASALPRLLSAVGATVFFLILWVMTGGRGLGFGDVKLSFLLGALLGYPDIIIALYIAFLTGALVGVILMMTGKKTLKSRVAFGPFLLFGTLVTIQYGAIIVSWWKGVI